MIPVGDYAPHFGSLEGIIQVIVKGRTFSFWAINGFVGQGWSGPLIS